MKMPIKIYSLEIELTRICNQPCAHCFRGDSENINMTPNIIDHIFKSDDHKITEIGNCLITGGEPFMNPEGFIYFLEYLIRNNIKIYEINSITNALVYNKEIIKLLKYLEKRKQVNIGLQTYHDQFHTSIPQKNLKSFSKTNFYGYYSENLTRGDITPLGRAFSNKLGDMTIRNEILNDFQNKVKEFLMVLYLREKLITIDSLYVTAKGYFGSIPIDATWQMIDEKYKLNILKDSLFTNCSFNSFSYDLKYMSATYSTLPIERFIEDYDYYQNNNDLYTFYKSLNEDVIKDYLVNPHSRKRMRN